MIISDIVVFITEHYVFDVKARDLTEVEKLIRFDPYMRVGDRLLQQLYQRDEEDLRLTEAILWDFAACYPDNCAQTFSTILLGESIHRRYVLIFCGGVR